MLTTALGKQVRLREPGHVLCLLLFPEAQVDENCSGARGPAITMGLGIDYSYWLHMQNNSRPLSDMHLFYPWRPGPVALTSSSLPTSLSFLRLG